MNNGAVNGTDPGISGYALREVSPPGPLAPTAITLGNHNIVPSTHVGTLTKTDPNPAYHALTPDGCVILIVAASLP